VHIIINALEGKTMLLMKLDHITYWPTLEAAAKIAERNMMDDDGWSYLCESINDGKTWRIAVWENDLHLGYL